MGFLLQVAVDQGKVLPEEAPSDEDPKGAPMRTTALDLTGACLNLHVPSLLQTPVTHTEPALSCYSGVTEYDICGL